MTERILAIDDEQHQLDTLCRGLRLYGFHCRGVRGAEAAIEVLASADGDGFDLVLADLTMPSGAGHSLIEHLQERWPDLPIVAVTGLAASAELGSVRDSNILLLHKPFDPDTLAATIRRALTRAAAGRPPRWRPR